MNLLNFKFYKNLILATCFLFNIINCCSAQIGKKVRQFKVSNVLDVSIDRLGEFYITFTNQSIKKYDSNGKYLFTFKSGQTDSITSLHPWNPLRVLLYDRKGQSIIFLDRSLSILQKAVIDPSFAIEPHLACASSNNNSYWIYDKTDLTIKKIDLSKDNVTSEIDLKKIYQNRIPCLSYIREYQNSLFLLDRNEGIKIISITGKLINSIIAERISNFGFVGEELYYLYSGKVCFYDLYTNNTHEIPLHTDVNFVLTTDDRIIVVKSKKVIVYIFKLT